MNSEFFSGTRPVLINSKVLKDINKPLIIPESTDPTWGQSIGGIYCDYIRPNMFALLVVLLISLYLFIKYLIKLDKDNKIKKKENFISMNPSVPVSKQPNHTRYLPDEKEVIRMNGKEYTYNSMYGKYMAIPETLIDDDYSIDNADELTTGTDDGWETRGTTNNWKDEEDSDMFNMYGNPHDYVKSTSDAMGYATDKNRDNLDNLAKQMFGENRRLKRNTGYDEYNL